MPDVADREVEQMLDEIFELSIDIRYAALYRNQSLSSRQRYGIQLGSASDSDRYEELLINPSILLLVRQRGNIDCGGAQFVVIRYGHFYQLVIDLLDGHVSVCLELTANPLDYAEAIRSICS